MRKEPYRLSFTTGALLHYESITVAELYVNSQDWGNVRRLVLDENRLQMRTIGTSKRIYWEIASRLKCLSADELILLLDLPPQDLSLIHI